MLYMLHGERISVCSLEYIRLAFCIGTLGHPQADISSILQDSKGQHRTQRAPCYPAVLGGTTFKNTALLHIRCLPTQKQCNCIYVSGRLLSTTACHSQYALQTCPEKL